MSQRISEKQLSSRVASLNRMYGFKGHRYVYNKTTRRKRSVGSGFDIDYAYGGARLVFITKSGGYKDVSLRGSKREVYDYIGAMMNALRYWKERTKIR